MAVSAERNGQSTAKSVCMLGALGYLGGISWAVVCARAMQAADFPLPTPLSPRTSSESAAAAAATSNTPVAAPSVPATPPAVSLLASLSSAAEASAYFQRALAYIFDYLLAIDWQLQAVELGPPPAVAPAPAVVVEGDAAGAAPAAASSSPAFALVPSTFTRERRDLMPILLPYSSLAIPRKKNSARSLTPLTKEFILRKLSKLLLEPLTSCPISRRSQARQPDPACWPSAFRCTRGALSCVHGRLCRLPKPAGCSHPFFAPESRLLPADYCVRVYVLWPDETLWRIGVQGANAFCCASLYSCSSHRFAFAAVGWHGAAAGLQCEGSRACVRPKVCHPLPHCEDVP